jgi:cytidylate kinase
MIIAIDGPAGAGKSTVTRMLAQRLDFMFLDTGAMYRAVTLVALENEIPLDDKEKLAKIASEIELRFDGDTVFIDGQNKTQEIRTPEVTRKIKSIADAVEVREHLVALQRRIAATGDFVSEGRDQGTVAFPNAQCKIYLTASTRFRAIRRALQLKEAGKNVTVEEVISDMNIRDYNDENRPVGRLMKADDAIEVNTDNKTIDDVVDELERIVKASVAKAPMTNTQG